MDVVGPVAHLTTMAPWGIDVGDHQQVVLATVLDHAGALEQSCLVGLALEDLLVGAFDDIGEIGLQFHHLARAIDDVHTVVVVEEERAVMEVAHAGDNLPRAFSLIGGEDIGIAHGTLLVGSQQSVELTLVVLQRGGPLSASIGCAFEQVVLWRIRQTVEDIAYGLPVLQILGGHDRGARHEVHGGGYEVEGVAYTDHVWIGYISPEHGVLNLVGSRLLCHCAQCGAQHQESKKSSHIGKWFLFWLQNYK